MPIETGSDILRYQGNAGLGYNSSIPAIDPKANLDVINSTARDIAMMNHANNIKLFDQKISDRDNTLKLLANGEISAGKIDPGDRKVYDEYKKKSKDKFYSMIQNGGLNNPTAVKEYYDSVNDLQNVATWAQSRQLEFDKLNAEKAGETLDEDINRYDTHIQNMKKQDFWNPIVPMQKAFNYDINEATSSYLGNPITGSSIGKGEQGTETTQWNTVTDKNGVITNKTTTKTAPLRSAQLTRQVPKTGAGVTVKPDGSLSEISYTAEKYWDYPTIETNVQEAYISSPKDRQTQIEWFNDVNAYPDAEKLRLLKAYNNRIAQYNQERGIESIGTNPDGTPRYENQVKFSADPTGKILIQETPSSFMAKHTLASIEGNYVEVPKAEVDYKIAEINKDLKLQRMRDATTRRGQDLDFKVQWKNAETSRMNALKKPEGSAAKFNANIQQPAILFGEHIERLKKVFDKNPNDLIVSYKNVDAKTRLATGLEEGDKITYKNDGSYIVTDKNGTTRIGTIEDLKQGFMNAVKAGLTTDGSQTEGFQTQAEEGFDNIFGTRSGDMIFKGWGKKTSQSESGGKQINSSDIPAKAAAAGYTEKEYRAALIKNGVKIIE